MNDQKSPQLKPFLPKRGDGFFIKAEILEKSIKSGGITFMDAMVVLDMFATPEPVDYRKVFSQEKNQFPK